MTALLDLPAIRERVARSSVEDYHWLGELPMELLRGTIIEKMSKSPSHQFYTDRLRKILSAQISPEWIARQGGPLTFADSEHFLLDRTYAQRVVEKFLEKLLEIDQLCGTGRVWLP